MDSLLTPVALSQTPTRCSRRLLACGRQSRSTDIKSPLIQDLPTAGKGAPQGQTVTQVQNPPKAELLSYSRTKKTSPLSAKRGRFVEQNNMKDSGKYAANFDPCLIKQTQVECHHSAAAPPSSAPDEVSLESQGLSGRSGDIFQTGLIKQTKEEPYKATFHPISTPEEASFTDCALSGKGMVLTEIAALAGNNSLDDSEDEITSSFDPALVTVDGYRVKEESAPLIRQIFKKHKDIAKNCSLQSAMSCSKFLEMICAIIQRLEGSTLKDITAVDLKSMLHQVADMKSIGLEVEWLRKKLDEINEAKVKFVESSSIKEAKTKSKEAIENIEREITLDEMMLTVKQDEVELSQAKITKLHREIVPLRRKISSSKKKLAGLKAQDEEIKAAALDTMAKVNAFFPKKSMVDGLL